MNELQIFNNNEFGEIRTIEENGKPLFCGKDIAMALGYGRTADAIRKHCKGVVKIETPTTGGIQEMAFITEGDLYRLIAHSKLPNAEKFEAWVFDEVLPTIRKHGAYLTPETLQEAILNPDTMIQLCQSLKQEQEKNKQLHKRIEEEKPKVLFADAVSTAKTSILVGDLAKLIKQNGYDIGQKRLFVWLRENGYLIRRKGTEWNMPTQKSMEKELFEVKETAITHADGHVSISKTVKVTGKGQLYFINKFLQAKAG